MLRMIDGETKGFIVHRAEPRRRLGERRPAAQGARSLDWLVVRDINEIETAAFWYDSPEIETGETASEDIGTEVFFLPAAAHTEKDGTFTNTQRLLQWHYKAVEPPEDCRSDLWFAYQLGRRLRAKLAGSTRPERPAAPRPDLGLPDAGPARRARRRGGPAGDQRPQAPTARSSRSTRSSRRTGRPPAAPGSTPASTPTASTRPRARSRAPSRTGSRPSGAGRGRRNRRILYNRASADPEGRPWSERKRYVWWDAERGKWTGLGDEPDFEPDKAPGLRAPTRARRAWRRSAATRRSSCIPTGSAGCTRRRASSTVRCRRTTSRTSRRSRTCSTRSARTRRARASSGPRTPTTRATGSRAPRCSRSCSTTYRLTEHHTAGGMSRSVPYLAELQPEMFCEVSPQLAAERGLEHGGWATIVTTRAAIEARVLVTDRIGRCRSRGEPCTRSGCPTTGAARGWSRATRRTSCCRSCSTATCTSPSTRSPRATSGPGRRPRGPALAGLVEEYRRRAGVSA